MNGTDILVPTALTDYVRTIKQLNQLVSNLNLEQNFKTIQQLEINALSIKELTKQSQQCLQELRMTLLTSQKYIFQLKQQKNVLKFQFEQCSKKYDRLYKKKSIIYQQQKFSKFQWRSFKKFQNSVELQVVVCNTVVSSESQHQQSTASCHLKQCLKNSFNALDNMENKIKLMLDQ